MAKLRPATAKWMSDIKKEFELESHHERILMIAAASWDLIEAARERVELDGAFIPDRFEALKAHPGIKVMQDNRVIFMRALRELALDVESPGDVGRPPSIQAGRR